MNSAPIKRACIMGYPVAQSRSPMMYGYWLKHYGLQGEYGREEVPPDGFAEFFATFRERGYVGGNVTAPHKLAALQAMSRIDAAAAAIGAVNTIWLEDGKWVGGNTDAYGFMANLDATAPGWDTDAKTAVVLGAGGATRAILFGLLTRGLDVIMVNRTRENAETLAAEFNAKNLGPRGNKVSVMDYDAMPAALAQADLLVNASVLGMLGKPPMVIDLSPLKRSAVVYDIVYVPLETALLKQARERGHRTVDGLGMLLHQGVPVFENMFGKRPEVTAEMRKLLEDDIRAKTPGA
jgi:shikimate dehydrogenase